MRDELSKRSVEQQQQQQRVSKKCHLFLGRLNLFDNFDQIIIVKTLNICNEMPAKKEI